MPKYTNVLILSGAIALGTMYTPATAADTKFGPSNPFYAPSSLPFHAPPFDKIKDDDYQPAIEAGMAEQLKEIQAIADNPAPPTFENTLVAMEKSGQLLQRAGNTFGGVVGANINPVLQKVREELAPKLAAHQDAITLNAKLFARIASVYKQRESLKLDPESLRLLQVTYDTFVRSGANLSEADTTESKKLNEEIATLSDAFASKLLEATKNGAYVTNDKSALAGLSDAQLAAAAQAAESRKLEGYVIPSRTLPSSRIWPCSASERRAKHSSKNPGTARSAATRPIRATQSRGWHNCVRNARNSLATPTTRRGAWETRWPRLPKPP